MSTALPISDDNVTDLTENYRSVGDSRAERAASASAERSLSSSKNRYDLPY